MNRGLFALVLALVAAATLAPSPASAQQQDGCLAPLVSIQPGPWVFEPKEAVGVLLTLENPNDAPVDTLSVSLDVSYPEGWSAVLAQREFSMGPRNVTLTGLSITSPPRGGGAVEGNVTVSAVANCVAGSIVTPPVRAAQGITVSLVPPTIPWFAIGLGVLGAIVLSILFFALQVRRGGIRLACEEPEKEVTPGRGVSFPLTLTNRGGTPLRVALSPPELPPGWSAHLAVNEIAMEARQDQELWLMVRAPPSAAFGEEHALTIRARALGDPDAEVRVPVKVRVSPPLRG